MRKGTVCAFTSCILWGLFPLALKTLIGVPAVEVLAYRVLWAFICALVVLLFRRDWRWFSLFMRCPWTVMTMVGSTVLLVGNWLLYIWAVNTNHIIESSLGYFVSPLINVLFGACFLHEKLCDEQKIALTIAAVGVFSLLLHQGLVPWISLTLAVLFSGYAFLRKRIPVGAVEGLSVEMLLGSIPASVYLIYLKNSSGSFGSIGNLTMLNLGFIGMLTAVLLTLYTAGARRLPLSLLGQIQYLTPTLQLLLGVFIYHEPLPMEHMVGFSLIWTALFVCSLSTARVYWRDMRLSYARKAV